MEIKRAQKKEGEPPRPPQPPPPLYISQYTTYGFQCVQYYTINSELVGFTSRSLKVEGKGVGAEAKAEVGFKGVGVEGKGEYDTMKIWDIKAYANPKFMIDGTINEQIYKQIADTASRAGTFLPATSQFKPLEEGKYPISNTATLDVDKDGTVSINGKLDVGTLNEKKIVKTKSYGAGVDPSLRPPWES